MKRYFVFVIASCVVTACASNPAVGGLPKPMGEHYEEIQLSKLSESEGTYGGVDKAIASHALLLKQGQKLPVKNIQGESIATGLSVLPPLCKKYPDGHLCFLFKEGTDEYIAVPTQTPKERAMPKAQWTLFKNGQELFSAPMNYGTEGPIISVTIVDGTPAVTFLRDLREGVLDDNGPKPREGTQDTYYKGSMLNKTYGLEASHAIFSFKGMVGFVGKLNGKEFLFFNGKAITESFDAIRTSSCCAVPHFDLKVSDNGALVFVGERGDYAYLTEVDLNEYL